MAQENVIYLVMTQLGQTSTTTAALYVNPEQEKAHQAAARMGNLNNEENTFSEIYSLHYFSPSNVYTLRI